jgi:hypothetical protein
VDDENSRREERKNSWRPWCRDLKPQFPESILWSERRHLNATSPTQHTWEPESTRGWFRSVRVSVSDKIWEGMENCVTFLSICSRSWQSGRWTGRFSIEECCFVTVPLV